VTRVQIGARQAYNIDLNKIPDPDPLAFAFGFVEGVEGIKRQKPQDRHGLAKGYIYGHALGRRVVEGREKMPEWAKEEGPSNGS
jgi:hypothetical protein